MSTKKVVVNKLTKMELRDALNANFALVKEANEDLADSIEYMAKMFNKNEKSVTKKDLLDLVKESMKTLGDKFSFVSQSVTPVAENSAKKSPKKLKKSDSVVSSSDVPENAPTAIALAKAFSETLEVEGAKYEIAHDIKTLDDLRKAYEDDQNIMFAMYWSKRHLAQFPYFEGKFETPDEFPNDIDLASCIYVSDEDTVAYAVSMYTEGCYMIMENDLKEFDGIRFSGGIEFQIYRQID